MSIWTNLFTGTSGLSAHGSAISVVGDNIANVSTTGYKASRAGFADVIGGRLGANRLGAGVRLGDVETQHGQGALQQTGGTFDLAVMGGGMFQVNGLNSGVQGSYYTRDGRFRLDESGFIVSAENLRLQGYSIDGAGTQSETLADLQLGATQTPPVATTAVDMSLNLDASAPAATFDPLDPDATSTYATSVTVYDSVGASHRVNVYFASQGNGNWEWHAMVDGAELTGGTPGTLTEVADGSLSFTANGELDTETTNASSVNFLNAAAGQTLGFDFGDALTTDGGTGLTGTTQFAGESSISSLGQDGYGFGTLVDVNISEDGTITGAFSNGQRRDIARVGLATFASETGLERAGNTLFAETSKSGQPLTGAAATGSRGSIKAGSLEASNVDLASELVTMISYQRAFQANARTVTTADEMLAEIANLKR